MEEQKKSRRITDVELYRTMEKVKANEEDSMKDALLSLLAVTVDLRAFLRKLYKEVVPTKERKNYEKK